MRCRRCPASVLIRLTVLAAFCMCGAVHGRGSEPSTVYLDTLTDRITSNQECGDLGLNTAVKLADRPAAPLQIDPRGPSR